MTLCGVCTDGWPCISLPSPFVCPEPWNGLQWNFLLIAYIRFLVAGVIPALLTPILHYVFVFGATARHWAVASSFTRSLFHTQQRSTVGRTPLDELSARRRDLYLRTHDTQSRQTSMPPVGFEPTISGWAATKPLLRLHGHWDQHIMLYKKHKNRFK